MTRAIRPHAVWLWLLATGCVGRAGGPAIGDAGLQGKRDATGAESADAGSDSIDADMGPSEDGPCGALGAPSPPIISCDACSGTELAFYDGGVSSIVVDPENAYWIGPLSQAASLFEALLDGGPVTAIVPISDYSTLPQSLAIYESNIYWLSGSNVMQQALDGGSPTVIVTGENPIALAVTATGVYWTDWGEGGTSSSSTGSVNRWSSGNGGVETLAFGQLGPTGLAVDATQVFWTDYGDSNNGIPGAVMGMALDGGSPTVLATGPVVNGEPLSPQVLTVDETNVYWVASGPGSFGAVLRVARTGGCVTVLAPALSPNHIAVDGTSVYWTDQGGQFPGGGGVYSVPLEGGPVTSLRFDAYGYFEPNNVVVGATHVLWTATVEHGPDNRPLGGIVDELDTP